MRTIIEPFRIKTVEPMRLTTAEERARLIAEAGLNPFFLRAEDVTIDLLTDSGTSAMSAAQWGAMMQGDESYAGARSWYRFRDAVREVFGFPHVVPTHQGRAAERILFSLLVGPGQTVPANTHFDTTRANIEARGGVAVDLPCAEAADLSSDAPFKGEMDIAALEALIEREGAENIPLVLLTVTNNSAGGQPVSIGHVEAVAAITREHGIRFYIDACRFAENAWLVKQREPGLREVPVPEIVRRMFAVADGCTMSAKKDGLANMGGFLCTRDPELARAERDLLVLTEGFPTYGGLAGRDLEAIAVGLREVLDPDYLAYRVTSTAYVVERLHARGVPVVRPAGGHAVYLDARRFLPDVPPLHYPGWALAVELFCEAGIRAVELGTVMFGLDPNTGEERPGRFDLVRLAIPRRVYTQSHMDYVIEAVERLWRRRREIRGLRITEAPRFLRHFTARFERR